MDLTNLKCFVLAEAVFLQALTGSAPEGTEQALVVLAQPKACGEVTFEVTTSAEQ